MHSFCTQFLVLRSAGILYPITEVVFRYRYFLISSSNISKTPFFRTLVTVASISSVEKDSIATTRESFKNCILACKINNQMHSNLEKRKVPQAASGNYVQKCLFCKTYALYNICLFVFDQKS